MMSILKKTLRVCAWLLLTLTVILLLFFIYVYSISDIEPPFLNDHVAIQQQRKEVDSCHFTLGANQLQRNKYGLYEMYVTGNAFERGVAFGKLGKELIAFQEEAFTHEIQRMVPNPYYLKFLKYVVGFMNRDLKNHVIPEYQNEIYGVSLSASSKFNWIGNNYTRQMNYHAAHDIGHALANMMLVGCTSFATWNDKSIDSQLIIGRNFDFYVGDEFAKNKIVAFYRPQKGIPFMSVTWGGFIGVVSGMNQAGLTVTINANKSAIPTGAATPVSLVAREILQYAHNIKEAYAIAQKREMFVSESFLIGSAADHKAVIIEKTPKAIHLYESGSNQITCTNHYQSDFFADDPLNQEQMANSASVYRSKHLQELLDTITKNTPQTTASILRDYGGWKNTDIGLTNEKAINQFICHHSIIFEPEKHRVWVSTAPWQLGEYICYDLDSIFNRATLPLPFYQEHLNLTKDPLVNTSTFGHVLTYLANEKEFIHHKTLHPNELLQSNPTYYDTYRLLGDYCQSQGKNVEAISNYQQALRLEIATEQERRQIQHKLSTLEDK